MKIARLMNGKSPTEKLFHHLSQKEFSSEEEMRRYMASIMGRPMDDFEDAKGNTPLHRAQFMIYDAWEEASSKKRMGLAKKALRVSPDCADAYNLMAEEAGTPQESLALYSKGVEAGRRALGEDCFREDEGRFWGINKTRPFMRAMAGKAKSLFETGDPRGGFDLYYEMLKLNLGDNQGIRYNLLARHGERMEYDAMAALLERFPDDASAEWVFTEALLRFHRQGDALVAKEALHRAMTHNPFVAGYLLGREEVPEKIPNQIVMGEKSEAESYGVEFIPVWQKVDGALAWLEQQEKIHDRMKSVGGQLNRNDPCVCGSGRKQKKCCGA